MYIGFIINDPSLNFYELTTYDSYGPLSGATGAAVMNFVHYLALKIPMEFSKRGNTGTRTIIDAPDSRYSRALDSGRLIKKFGEEPTKLNIIERNGLSIMS